MNRNAILFLLATVCAITAVGQIKHPCVDDPPYLVTISLTASTPTETSVDLVWPDAAPWGSNLDASYRVKYKLSTSGTYILLPTTHNESVTIPNLTAGSQYDFIVVASASCDQLLDPGPPADWWPYDLEETSDPVTVTLKPARPTSVSASALTSTSFRVTNDAMNGATGYLLDISTSSSFGSFTGAYHDFSMPETATQDVTGLSPNTLYYFRTRASNSAGTSGYSSTASVVTKPAAPQASDASTVTSASFAANWTAVSSSGYALDVATDASFNDILPSYNSLAVTGTSKAVSGLASGFTYYYRVRALNTTSASGNSNVVSVTTLPQPLSVSGITSSSFSLSWNPSVGATGYVLDVSTDADFDVPDIYNNVAVTSPKQITGLNSGTQYYCRMRAVSPLGTSVHSKTGVTTLPGVPVVSTGNVGTTSFSISWNAVTGATGYRLDVATDDSFTSLLEGYDNIILSGNTLTKEITGLQPNTTYFYRIRAANASGVSQNPVSTEVLTYPAAPANFTIGGTTPSAIRADWEPIPNILFYQLEASRSESFDALIPGYPKTISEGSSDFTLSGLEPGTLYYLRIAGKNATGLSAYSRQQGTTRCLAPQGLTASEITTSSFKTSWTSVNGATGYRLDVATDKDFTAILDNYNDKIVAETHYTMTGLTAGTTYYYRVRAMNAAGASENTMDQALTYPAAPASFAIGESTSSSIRVHWEPVPGILFYQLEASLSSSFDELASGFPETIPAGTSDFVLSGLRDGTVYYLRIAVKNTTGFSVYSYQQGTTRCLAPQGPAVSETTTSSFQISWALSNGATAYRLDVATDPVFSALLENYDNKQVTETQHAITGLTAGTAYYYRVRAVNAAGASENTSGEALTLPGIPQNFRVPFEEAGSGTLHVYWDAVASATHYELEVARNDLFTDLVSGYNPKIQLADVHELIVEGLLPDKNYYLRVRARNPSGLSANSVTKPQRTKDTNGNQRKIAIVNSTGPVVLTGGASAELSVTTNGEAIGRITAYLYHRKCSSAEYIREELAEQEASRYATAVSDAWLDDLGMQYYFQVKDESGVVVSTPPVTLVRKERATIPVPPFFGKDVKNYHIISLPLNLTEKEDRNIEGLFVEAMGEYDDTRWRLLRYDNGKLIDYPSLRVRKLERGQAYWFISESEITLDFGEAVTYGNNVDEPFSLVLKKGWNQIGNPYPYHLDWQEVLAYGTNSQHIRPELWVFDRSNFAFAKSDLLTAFSGGYILALEDATLTFPTTLSRQLSGGRSRAQAHTLTVAEGNGWILPFTLKQGRVSNTQSAIGMVPDASEGMDRHDLIPPPRFVRYLQFLSRPEGESYDFSKNMVEPRHAYTWNYVLEHNGDEPVSLLWDRETVRQTGGNMVLHDLTNHRLTDMASADRYEIKTARASFHIYFSDQQPGDQPSWEGASITLGTAYPNPFTSTVNIPFSYSDTDFQEKAILSVFDMQGRKIAENAVDGMREKGLKTITWNGTTNAGSVIPAGVYRYELSAITAMGPVSFHGKLIKQ